MGFENFHHEADSESFGFLNAISVNLLHLGLLSYPILYQSRTSRILCLSSCFSTFVLFSFYTADLTSLMTSGSSGDTIKSFQDAHNMGLTMGVMEGMGAQILVE